ncbi:hypothetical protein [Aureibacter tunicatorum]|uniref:UDP-N-acetyl-D-mannosaminuronate dehydrogenase n=1 Tax=Aureibacter tunicatorum TaxID=866807 RepID=A0AAE3XRP3_9BACT|nr:hypothetical protein [Aureibacter tunicatorum]MDR6240705.1 UDP-N-acetyl-D-mannosaminuronate dehydrogenase [Aureibacter tunicatorum]BDD06962.1 hypothetical protein AUTU_44450 [Aureibacter tunicatorum]
MIPDKVTSICCIGTGYLGGPTMSVIVQKYSYLKVTVVDINADPSIDILEKNKPVGCGKIYSIESM